MRNLTNRLGGVGSGILGVVLSLLVGSLTVAPVSWANHTVTRICMDLDATAVSVKLYFRTGDAITGPLTVKTVLRADLASDPVKCPAPSVGVLPGSLGLPDSSYFVKASALNAGGHESLLTAEASGTPFPLSSVIPAAPSALRVVP